MKLIRKIINKSISWFIRFRSNVTFLQNQFRKNIETIEEIYIQIILM